jgi:hypothetical protein
MKGKIRMENLNQDLINKALMTQGTNSLTLSGTEAFSTDNGEVSAYSLSGEPTLVELSAEKRANVLTEIKCLFETAFETEQNNDKIKILFELMIYDSWTTTRCKDAIKYFLKHVKTYYNKWIFSDIMSFDKKAYTYSKMYMLCEIGRNKSDFKPFQGVNGEIYYWDINYGRCPFPKVELKQDEWIILDNEIENKSMSWNVTQLGEIPEEMKERGWAIRKY